MSDKILVNGMVWGRKEPLLPPMEYEDFVRAMLDALGREKEHFRSETAYALRGMAFRGAFEFMTRNLNDPLESKWALLLPPKDRGSVAVAEALNPLVQHRQGRVIFSPTSPGTAFPEEWISDFYSQMEDEERPYYGDGDVREMMTFFFSGLSEMGRS